MPLIYKRVRNQITGQVCHLPAGRYGNFLNSVKKIVNYVSYNYEKFYIVHLTLTVAENISDISCDHLHRVDTFIQQRLKRAGAEGKRIAVKEFQERGAIHFHVLYIYNKAYVFPHREDIAKSWKLGFVKISAPKIHIKLYKIVNYIGKYIGKGYEYEALENKKSFTASQIKQIYKLSANRLEKVIRRFGKAMAEQFQCTFRRVYLVGYLVNEILGTKIYKPFRDLIMEFQSDWRLVGDPISVKGVECIKPYVYKEPF